MQAPAIREHESVVHVFEALGRHYAYFGKTADVAEIDSALFAVLRRYEDGAAPEPRAALTAESIEQGERIAALSDLGLLEPQPGLSAEQVQSRIDALFQHSPRNLMFLVTEACNLACTYCYEVANGVHDRPAVFRRDDARRAIDGYLEEAKPRGYACITFFGGEPLLNFKVIEDIVVWSKARAHELGMTVGFSITSNLTLLTESIADFLAREQFSVMVSIDGPRHIHDRHRVAKCSSLLEGTHDRVVDRLQLLIERCRVHGTRLPRLRATLTRPEEHEEVEAYLTSLGTGLIEIGVADDDRGILEKDGPSCPSKAQPEAGATAPKASPMVELERRFRELAERLGRGDLSAIPLSIARSMRMLRDQLEQARPRSVSEPRLCGVARNMKAVTPTGDIYPCHRYVGMPAFRLGNVFQGGLDEARTRDYYEKIYASFRAKCARCWARHLCGGQCPWQLSNDAGEVTRPLDEACIDIKRGFELRLALYAQTRHVGPDGMLAAESA